MTEGQSGPEPDGGALKYGEGNWEIGLPTSDVYNHVMEHLIIWGEEFRRALLLYEGDMSKVREHMAVFSRSEDDLAGAMWGLMVLMTQERDLTMYHDERFFIPKGSKSIRRGSVSRSLYPGIHHPRK